MNKYNFYIIKIYGTNVKKYIIIIIMNKYNFYIIKIHGTNVKKYIIIIIIIIIIIMNK